MARRNFAVLTALGFVVALGVRCGGNPQVSNDGDGGGAGTAGAGGADASTGATGGTGATIGLPDGSGGTGGECGPDAGVPCGDADVPDPTCGDGLINQAGEVCDDGNAESGDGCTGNCEQIEADFVCPTPGTPCVSTVVCGDSQIRGTEQCDDGNSAPNDGCDASCQIEAGWACPFVGLKCEAAECGDGIAVGNEECEYDVGQTPADGGGCSATCRIEPGFDCDPVAHTCAPTVCGDGDVERGEQCEDGNDLPFDGCFECRSEPVCGGGGSCTSACGDGQRFDDEACDDGNNEPGDGCSETCEIETGFECVDVTASPPPDIRLPVIFRDFVGRDRGLMGMAEHEDFNRHGGSGVLGIVEDDLGPDGRPVYSCPGGDCSQNPGHLFIDSNGRPNMSTQANFDEWYRDVSGVNITVPGEVLLDRQPSGAYLFDSADTSVDGIDFFDPLNNDGWVALGMESQTCDPARNVSFTSETHFWFEYQGGERFDFSGDDDTWVFVNDKLVIDLGGLHVRLDGFFVLDDDTDGAGPDTADGTASFDSDLQTAGTIDLGMVPGGVYEVVMFHAERNECGSNFTVTLKDFNKPESECMSICGDGIVASDELCDDGPGGNDGGYGNCGPDCRSRGPFCGDGTVDSSDGEQCDDGVNISQYGGCAPGCVDGPFCGDGIVQGSFESCDDGTNDGGYEECAPGCVFGERCGDGTVQMEAGEECDDGNRMNGDGCTANCKRVEVR